MLTDKEKRELAEAQRKESMSRVAKIIIPLVLVLALGFIAYRSVVFFRQNWIAPEVSLSSELPVAVKRYIHDNPGTVVTTTEDGTIRIFDDRLPDEARTWNRASSRYEREVPEGMFTSTAFVRRVLFSDSVEFVIPYELEDTIQVREDPVLQMPDLSENEGATWSYTLFVEDFDIVTIVFFPSDYLDEFQELQNSTVMDLMFAPNSGLHSVGLVIHPFKELKHSGTVEATGMTYEYTIITPYHYNALIDSVQRSLRAISE